MSIADTITARVETGASAPAADAADAKAPQSDAANAQKSCVIVVENLPVPLDRRVWQEARALRDAGWELGGHTVHHPILSRLDEEGAFAEMEGSATSMERELGSRGRTFAYPFGRRWDWNADTLRAVERAGYAFAVHTHAGANGPDTPAHRMARLAFDDDVRIHRVVAEACGGYDLLRRVGLDLSE